MLNNVLFICLLTTGLFFSACGDDTSTNIDNVAEEKVKSDDTVNKDTLVIEEELTATITGNVEDKYYGKWIFAENGDELNIDTSTKLNYIASNDNLLIVTETDGTKKSYIRASPSKVNLTGKLEKKIAISLSPSKKAKARAPSYASIGSINIILENILDENIQATITTDENGYFEDSSLPAGEYTIKAEDEDIKLDTIITLSDKEEDLGTFIILDETQHNFKAELILNNSFIIADKEKNTVTLRIHNISTQKAYAVWFEVKIFDSDGVEYSKTDIQYSDTTSSDSSIGTIMPKSYNDIDISFAFEPIIQNNQDTTIKIIIHDGDNKTWSEELKFILYKDTFDINMDTSESNLKGYIRLPYNDKILAIDMAKGSITLPLLNEDIHYTLVLANSGALGGETKYSIGLNTPTIDFTDFKNTGAYENDDSEAEATKFSIGDESIVSYIHYGDLDYWKILTPNDNTPGNLAPTANAGSDKIAVENEIVVLDASSSSDTDGSIVGYEWKENDTLLSSNVSFSKTDFIVGTHTVTLTIKDNKGAISTDQIQIQISKFINTPPIANAGADQRVMAENFVQLNGNLSSDIDGDILNYKWVIIKKPTINDGDSSSEISILEPNIINPSISLDYEGIYEFRLTVNDGLENSTDNIIINYNRLSRDNNGIITDHYTNLMWQDNSANMDVGERSHFGANKEEAISFCDNLTLGGYTDWYLPSFLEMRTIYETDFVSDNRDKSVQLLSTFSFLQSDMHFWTSDTSTSSIFMLDNQSTWWYPNTSDNSFNGSNLFKCVRSK